MKEDRVWRENTYVHISRQTPPIHSSASSASQRTHTHAHVDRLDR